MRFTIITAILILSSTPIFSHTWQTNRADAHAPIGVMQDHTHNKGEWMISARTMTMPMTKVFAGNNELSPSVILENNNFMMTPETMEMKMNMAGIMYAPTNKLTLMGMIPFKSLTMRNKMKSGMKKNTAAEGLGDISISGLYAIKNNPQHKSHLSLGLILPTGDDETTDTISGSTQRLPYPMQLGSGTYTLTAGYTTYKQTKHYSWGQQLAAKVPLTRNQFGFAHGNRAQYTAWLARAINKAISLSSRVNANTWTDIQGEDKSYNKMMSPVMNPDNYAGTSIEIGLGLNLLATKGKIKGHRLAVEYMVPIHQNLDGATLGVDNYTMFGWQKAF